MAPDSFHRFSALPFELRRMIYLFATPPRFVHVQEDHEDEDDFEERFRTTIVQINLHPSIVQFARNWRGRIPFPQSRWRWYDGRHQTTLERYGFKGPRPKQQQPWEPTGDVPGLPYHFLSENPQIAWQLLRNGSFYSTAPIPALLHVTSESRQVLIDYGYELAFRTRTSGPHTWFNFKIDVLYIGRCSGTWDSHPQHALLSGTELWELGQFEPQELKKVRRLALEDSSRVVISNYQSEIGDGAREISNMLELFFTNVEELFLEEPSRDRLNDTPPDVPDADRQLWVFTPPLEVDTLASYFKNYDLVYSTGYEHLDLRAYKEDNMGDGSNFFVDTACKFEQRLASIRDELIRDVGSSVPYKVPKISLVHICYPWVCKALFDLRRDLWNRYEKLREADARSRAAEEAMRSIDVPKRPIYEPDGDANLPSPFSEEFRDDLDVWAQMQEDYYYPWQHMHEEHYYAYSGLYGTYEEERARFTWLVTGTISAPEMG
ncbi:hypothetical protein GGR58DRAFT_462562 [Xylaria digitata]|nr:hypothetical protein GGR58DRAFT_462562 [Xylaria digitata]